MKDFFQIHNLFSDSEYSKKIAIYFSPKAIGEDFDPYESNYDYETNRLNPVSIKGIVTQVNPTQLVYKQYGLDKQGTIEILTESKYSSWFENAVKITVDNVEYEVFRDKTGGRSLITERANNVISVVLTRK